MSIYTCLLCPILFSASVSSIISYDAQTHTGHVWHYSNDSYKMRHNECIASENTHDESKSRFETWLCHTLLWFALDLSSWDLG